MRKGLNMFRRVNVPVLGIIENMSYLLVLHAVISVIFLEREVLRLKERLGLPFLGGIP